MDQVADAVNAVAAEIWQVSWLQTAWIIWTLEYYQRRNEASYDSRRRSSERRSG